MTEAIICCLWAVTNDSTSNGKQLRHNYIPTITQDFSPFLNLTYSSFEAAARLQITNSSQCTSKTDKLDEMRFLLWNGPFEIKKKKLQVVQNCKVGSLIEWLPLYSGISKPTVFLIKNVQATLNTGPLETDWPQEKMCINIVIRISVCLKVISAD